MIKKKCQNKCKLDELTQVCTGCLRTIEEIMEAGDSHTRKMEAKRKRRELWYKSTGEPLIMANLSANHPEYGLSPEELEKLKNNS